jgi:serine/threonine-protein kinase ULK4
MSPAVDVMRISLNVQRNLLRDTFKEGYEEALPSSQLVLEDHDQEVDMGNKPEEDEDTTPTSASDPEGFLEEEEAPSRLDMPEEDRQLGKFKAAAERTRPIVVGEADSRPSSVNPRSSDGSVPQTPSSRSNFKSVPVDQLLLHNSDTAVKPIIGNRDIEKVPPVTFNPHTLPLQPWDPQQVMQKIDSSELEVHLNQVYSILTTSTNAVEKLNLLSYFELVISNSTVANHIVNSVFMELLLRSLRTAKTNSLRMRICSILGQIVRHATVIEIEVAQMRIADLLSDYVKDKNDKVRRRAMAALGEYLFYAATQTDEEYSDTVWEVSPSQVALLVRVMRQTEDEVLRSYAVKTIENITAQSKSAGVRFAISDSATQLIAVYNSAKLEALKVSAIVAASHVTRLNPSLFPAVIERLGLRGLVAGLSEGPSRVQQAMLTMLLLGLQAPPPRLSSSLLDDQGFLPALVALLEHAEVVIRGKSLLVLKFLVKLNTRWLMKASEGKFFPLLDRLSRDNYKYVQCCLHHLIDTLTEATHLILQNAAEEVSPAARSSSRIAALSLLPALEHTCASAVVREKLNYDIVLRALRGVLSSGEGVQAVLTILDSICSSQKILALHAEAVLSLLPAMMAQLTLDNADLRCQVLKATYDLLLPFLSNSEFYEPGNSSKVTTKLINELLIQQVLPVLPRLLKDTDPIPLYAQKLISAVLEHCLAFVGILKRHGLVTLLFEDFEPTQTKLNAHIISIVKRVVESKEVSLNELAAMQLIPRLNAVVEYLHEQDWCLEVTLDILLELLVLTAEQLRAQRDNPEAVLSCTQPLVENIGFCAKLSIKPVGPTQEFAEKASSCLTMIVQLFGRRCLRSSVSSKFLGLLRHPSVNVLKATLKLAQWGVLQGEIRREAVERSMIELMEHPDSSVSAAAVDLYKAVR